MISLRELAGKIKAEQNVCLICHVRPDGDTLGSALALKNALNNLGIGAEVFCDDLVPSRFLFLNEVKSVKREITGQYSAMIAIDCADVNRLGEYAQTYVDFKNTYSIDHHVSNTRYSKINYVFDNASNSENIYQLICEMGAEITPEIANLLMMGIMTDTGNFRHKNVTANTFFTAAKLKEKGADVNNIYYHMFSSQTKERAKLFGETMRKIRYFYDGKLAITCVSKEDIENTGASFDQTEGFIDFIMGIIGVEIGIVMSEVATNKYKVSLRAKSANVNAVASSFGGGGHVLASGCQIYGEYEEVVDKLRIAAGKEIPDCL